MGEGKETSRQRRAYAGKTELVFEVVDDCILVGVELCDAKAQMARGDLWLDRLIEAGDLLLESLDLLFLSRDGIADLGELATQLRIGESVAKHR